MVKWNLFRGRLERSLGNLSSTARSYDKALHIIKAETQGKIEPSVMQAYLKQEREDLPDEYLTLLLGIPRLSLSTTDYTGVSEPSPWFAPSRKPHPSANWKNKPSQVLQLDLSYAKTKLERELKEKPRYQLLGCKEPDAIRSALRDRIERAGITDIELGRTFGLKIKRSSCEDLLHFFHQDSNNPLVNAPSFSGRLQDRFWDICALLNEEIHKREGGEGPALTTEQFVLDLFREGTVDDPGNRAKMLKRLSEHYHAHISPHTR